MDIDGLRLFTWKFIEFYIGADQPPCTHLISAIFEPPFPIIHPMSSLGTVISCVCWLAWGRLCCWVPKAARAKTIIVKIHYQCNRKFWKVHIAAKFWVKILWYFSNFPNEYSLKSESECVMEISLNVLEGLIDPAPPPLFPENPPMPLRADSPAICNDPNFPV